MNTEYAYISALSKAKTPADVEAVLRRLPRAEEKFIPQFRALLADLMAEGLTEDEAVAQCVRGFMPTVGNGQHR